MDNQVSFDDTAKKPEDIKVITAADIEAFNKLKGMISSELLDQSAMYFRNNKNSTSYQSVAVRSKETPYRDETAEENTFARIKTTKILKYIGFSSIYSDCFKNANIEFSSIPSDKGFIRIPIDILDNPNAEFKKIINTIFFNSFCFEPFGCCEKYIECSDATKCLHPDKLYSRVCMYRKNLENGRIFYGKNKNV